MLPAQFGAPGARMPRLAAAASRADIARPMYTNAEIGGPLRAKDFPVGGAQNAGAGSSVSGSSSQQPQQSGSPSAPTAPPPPNPYDLNADPVLQQVQAAVTLGGQQANASALRAREQALLQYGDPSLAAATLGANDPFVKAAGQNQESTLALLGRGYHQGLENFDNNLDPSLVYSGARIKGEGLLGQSYQDELARAAAGVQGQLGSITDALNSALQSNQDRYDQALADAYSRAVQQALANPPADATTPAASSAAAPPKSKPKPRPKRLAHAAAGSHHPHTRPHAH